MYKIEQLLPSDEWVDATYILESLNEAIKWFRDVVLRNPDTTFRLTAHAAD